MGPLVTLGNPEGKEAEDGVLEMKKFDLIRVLDQGFERERAEPCEMQEKKPLVHGREEWSSGVAWMVVIG